MKKKVIIFFLIIIIFYRCGNKIGPSIHYFKKDGVRWYTSKIYGYPDGKKTLIQKDTYKKNDKSKESTIYNLQESIKYYERWPNGELKFVSKEGFKVVENGKYILTNDSVKVPDNIIYKYYDNKYVEHIKVYKDGKRIDYTLGYPDGHQSTQYLRDTPGIYSWKDGKEYLVREFTDEEKGKLQTKAQRWDNLTKSDKRLLPKYGNLPKSEEEKNADNEFIKTILEKEASNKSASNHLIELGFKYLQKDLQAAMSRFNQAYLLDSTNTDIYWGFGAVYFTVGNLDKAKKQYLEGLAINPENPHLLTDYATCFLSQYYNTISFNENRALLYLDTAISLLSKSYQLNVKDPNTTLKLSICNWNKGNCEEAWRYYDESKKLGSLQITEDYTNDLKKKCKRN